jgi:hypothetical protein
MFRPIEFQTDLGHRAMFIGFEYPNTQKPALTILDPLKHKFKFPRIRKGTVSSSKNFVQSGHSDPLCTKDFFVQLGSKTSQKTFRATWVASQLARINLRATWVKPSCNLGQTFVQLGSSLLLFVLFFVLSLCKDARARGRI